MFQPLVDVMEKFITDFSWKRIIILLGFLSLVIFAFIFYEAQTSTSQLSKYERTVVLLEKLDVLNQNNSYSKNIVKKIYIGLENINNPISNTLTFSLNLPREIKQVLLASIPWVLFSIVFLPGFIRGDEESRNIFGGLLVILFLVGFGGYVIPASWGSIIGYILYPLIINFLIFVFLIRHGKNTD